MKKLYTISIILAMTSCAPVVNYFQQAEKNYRSEVVPNINQINETELGYSLISEKNIEQADFIIINEIPKIKYFGFEFTNNEFQFMGNDKGSNKVYYGVEKKFPGLYIQSNERISAIIAQALDGRFILQPIDRVISYSKIKKDIVSDKFYKQEFLYNGKSGNIVKFTYREFSGDIIRPAFSQDVQYDLNESNIIGFKKLRIEILETSNTNIKYKILNSF